MTNTANLSPEAQSVLINLGTSRQGVTPKRGPTVALVELQSAGILGEDYGLTGKGSRYRDRLMSARLDAAFS